MGTTRDMVLKMIIRCGKVKRHKPKKVKEHVLKFDGQEAPIFPEELEKTYYSRLQTLPVKTVLEKHCISDSES